VTDKSSNEPRSAAPVTIFPDAAGAIFTSYDNLPSVRFIADERSTRSIRLLNTVGLSAIAVVPNDAPPIDAAAPAATPDDESAS
jgi:hypothetical protein